MYMFTYSNSCIRQHLNKIYCSELFTKTRDLITKQSEYEVHLLYHDIPQYRTS